MNNEDFIRLHLRDDVRALALRRAEDGVDVKWCLQQIEGWQKAADKLPRWARTEGLWYPPSLSMEQCSGEPAAGYKADIVKRLLPEDCRHAFADLTGGYGIDFSYMAPLFQGACYVERSPGLCRIAEHNFPVLGLGGAEVVCADATDFLKGVRRSFDLVFLDPARRDGAGRKTVQIEECTPDVCTLQGQLLDVARYVIVKLSPMLDISAALERLHGVSEVHVVCVGGECKELLFVQQRGYVGSPVFHAVNISPVSGRMSAGSGTSIYICTREEMLSTRPILPGEWGGEPVGRYLYEPHAGILKAGLQDTLCRRYGVAKLHPMSNLFTSTEPVAEFPGRSFELTGWCGFGKKDLRTMLGGVSCANLTVRNFPATVAELRKKLHLHEGGDVYLFATTLEDGSHALVRCRKQA